MNILTIKEVSELLNVKIATIYSWSNNGKIPFIKLNGLLRFDNEEICRWIKEGKRENVCLSRVYDKKKELDIDSIVKKAIDVSGD